MPIVHHPNKIRLSLSGRKEEGNHNDRFLNWRVKIPFVQMSGFVLSFLSSLSISISNSPIYLSIFACPTYIWRVECEYKHWLNRYGTIFPNSTYEFISEQPLPCFANNTRVFPPTNRSNSEGKLFILFYNTLKHFVTELPAMDWYFRATDDVIFDLPLLAEFIDSLSKNINPRKDFVFKGQVVRSHNGKYVIHGGSGFLISRAAATDIYSRWNDFPNINGVIADDIKIAEILLQMNRSLESIHEPSFLGAETTQGLIKTLQFGAYSALPSCESIKASRKIEKFGLPYPLNKVMIWHGGYQKAYILRNFDQFYGKIPSNVSYFVDNRKSRLCIDGS